MAAAQPMRSTGDCFVWNKFKTAQKPIVLYGMGNGADKIILELEKRGIPVAGVMASDDFVRGQSFHGFVVQPYRHFKETLKNFIVLICFGTNRPEVLSRIRQIAKEQETYAPDVPVIGGGLFTTEYAKKHEKALAQVYDLLYDEDSRRVFENCVRYRLTGDIRYLFDCESSVSAAFSDILQPGPGEIYLDLGAYNGDTVLQFAKQSPAYRQMLAVEPDRKNFKKLQKNTEGLRDVTCYPVCISDHSGAAFFRTLAGRNSAIGEGGAAVRAESVDSLLNSAPVTTIKMDVEGGEAAAIAGALDQVQFHELRTAYF